MHEAIKNAIISLGSAGYVGQRRRNSIIYNTTHKPGGAWIYIKYNTHNCTLLKTFMYDLISKKLPYNERFIPSECQNCYKVVARPERYEDFLKLKDIMFELDMPSKIGIEKRDSVDALFGAYWYCIGLEHGREVLEKVKEATKEIDMPVFLKRGCTEYENDFGRSDKWEVTEAQKELEDEILSFIDIKNHKAQQTDENKANIMQEWAKFVEMVGSEYKGSHDYITY